MDSTGHSAARPLGVFNVQGARLIDCKILTPSGLNQIASRNASVEIW
jgi:hypothetical protein